MVAIGAYSVPSAIYACVGAKELSIGSVAAIAQCVLYAYVCYNAQFYIVAKNYNVKNDENAEKNDENAEKTAENALETAQNGWFEAYFVQIKQKQERNFSKFLSFA